MNNSDIIHCYNRFLVKCCENKMSLLYFAKKLNNLYPDRLGLYCENKIFKFFKSFLYSDYKLTEDEKKYLISVKEDIKLWDGPIIEDNHFSLDKLITQNKDQNVITRKRNRSNESGESECKRSNYIKIENINENPNIYKNEKMEAKPIENKIDILKLNIERRLNECIPENEIKNKIINNMFNDISKINDLKYEYMKKINILNKKEDELISQLNDIKKKKYEYKMPTRI